jgi:hypothetical protein
MMANPTISLVTVSKSTLKAGERFTVKVDASDPDAMSGTQTITVRDAAGNTAQALVQLSISDPLTYEVEDTDGLGITYTADANDPSLFHGVAP